MSQRETVLAAVAATLVAANVAGGRVYRSRQESIATLPAVIVEPVSEQVAEVVLGLLDRTLVVAVTVLAKGDTPDNAADATLDAAISALLADRPLGFGGEVQVQSEHDLRWEFEDFDLARVTATLQIRMRTAS